MDLDGRIIFPSIIKDKEQQLIDDALEGDLTSLGVLLMHNQKVLNGQIQILKNKIDKLSKEN